jgi:hypothetical protein
MPALSIQPAFPIFTDTDGQPLENGYIWIGAANLDPQGNPIAVFYDAALTIPAVQPIRTLGGYPMRSGTPARLYVDSDYSIRVMGKNGTTVYNAATATERYSNVVVETTFTQISATGDGVQAVFAVPSRPQLVFVNGEYRSQNGYTFAGGFVTFSFPPSNFSAIEFLI